MLTILVNYFCGEKKESGGRRIGGATDEEDDCGRTLRSGAEGRRDKKYEAHARGAERDRAEGRPGGRAGAEEGEVRVRELVALLEANGWRFARQKGSHKQFKHPDHAFLITVPDHRGDVKPGILADVLKKAGVKQ